MWYKFSKQKFNLFGLPITGKSSIKQFVSDEDSEVQNIEEIDLSEPETEEELIEDPTPENEFTPEDLQINIDKIENDPTINYKLPPSIHENCRCRIKTIPILSKIGINDGRRIWELAENCCDTCRITAESFNRDEIQRLINKGIDVNIIP